MEGGKKVALLHFLADQKIASLWKKCVLGHPIARAAFHCEESTHQVKAAKGLKQCQAKVKGVNNPT